MKQRILFFLILLAAIAMCLLPALCFGQTVGQFGIPKWTAGGTRFQWVTPQNSKVFGLDSSGNLVMSTAAGGSWGSITGTLSAQTDLQSALDAKQEETDWLTALGTIAGAAADQLILTDGAGSYVQADASTVRAALALGSMALLSRESPRFVTSMEVATDEAGTVPALAFSTTVMAFSQAEGTGTLQANTLSDSRSWVLPDASGTLLLSTSGLNATNISSGSLALVRIAKSGATSGQAIAWNGSAWAPATIAATPGGSSGQVQYNNGGSFGGVSGLTLTTGTLSAASITGGTVTSSAPLISMSQTWNAAAVFHAADISITNTASSAGSTLQRWRVGGSDIFSIASNTVGGNETSPWRAVLGTDASIGYAPAYSAITVRNAANTDWKAVYAGAFATNTGVVTSATVVSAGGINGTEGDSSLDSANWRGPGLRMRNSGTITWTTGTTVTSAADIIIDIGTASPEAAVTANPGSMYLRNNGGAGELWIKTSGTGNTGWSQVTIP